MIKCMDRVHTLGLMVKPIAVVGRKIKCMAMVPSKKPTAQNNLVTGLMANWKVPYGKILNLGFQYELTSKIYKRLRLQKE